MRILVVEPAHHQSLSPRLSTGARIFLNLFQGVTGDRIFLDLFQDLTGATFLLMGVGFCACIHMSDCACACERLHLYCVSKILLRGSSLPRCLLFEFPSR